LEVSLAPAPRGTSLYFALAAVGLFTLLVGASVRLRRPRDQATLHFFWLCVAFFGVFTFSFNGPFDRLDWIFYCGDAIAFALPPLLLHFTMVFPQRQNQNQNQNHQNQNHQNQNHPNHQNQNENQNLERRTPNAERPWLVPLMYLPALLLATARVVAIARASNGT